MTHRNARRRNRRPDSPEALEGRSLLSTAASNLEVDYLYETLLERAPTASELSYYADQLDSGTNPAVVYGSFVDSAEHQALVTAGTYTGTPLSTADEATFDTEFAADVAAANATASVTSGSLAGTADVATYVDSLYANLLGRSPSSDEETYYVDEIGNGATLGSVVAAFLNSPEYQAMVTAGTAPYTLASGADGDTTEASAFVNSLYSGLLNRTASSDEVTYYVDQLGTGTSPSTLITNFLQSPEYLSLINEVNAIDPTEAVNFMYQTLLERAPSASELSSAVSAIDGGESLATEYQSLVDSSEHQGLVTGGTYTGTPLSTTNATAFDLQFVSAVAAADATQDINVGSLGTSTNVATYVDALYSALLKRTPSADEQSYYVDEIEGGASLASVALAFVNSPEYQAMVSAGTAPYTLATGTAGDTTEASAFVNSLYSGLLDRTASSDEVAYYVDKLAAGTNPNILIAAFIQSPEYITDTVGTVVPGTALSDNLADATAGTETATDVYELTASFTTDASTYTLDSVTLPIDEMSAGTATVEIYSDGGLQPGSLVGTLTSPATYSSSVTDTTFTSSGGITLSANTKYWVVLVANSGSFGWSWTTDTTSTGAGFTGEWGYSTDSSPDWFTYNTYPLQMSVTATAS